MQNKTREKIIDFIYDGISEKLGRWLCNKWDHPAGVYWFNVCGIEPDMRCKSCGEDLG